MNDVSLNKKVPLWPLWVLFFTSTDTLLFGTNANNTFLYVPRIVGLFIFAFLPIILKKTIIANKKTLIAFILCSIALISAVFNETEIPTIISRIIPILAACSVATYYEHKDYVNVFCKFVYFVSVVAIITEFFAYVFPAIFNIFPTVINTSKGLFSCFFFGTMRYSFIGDSLIRAGGIFWEPGAFSIYINLAIMYELFFEEKPDIKHICADIIALLITFSTTGYIGFFVMITIYILAKKSITKKQLVCKLLLCFGMVILIVCTIGFETSQIYEFVFGKIENAESTTITRYSSIINGLEIGWNNPIFGVGSNRIEESIMFYAEKSSFGKNPMLTNTCTIQFATFGMIFGTIYLLYTIRYFTKQNMNLLCRLGLPITLMLLYCGEAFYSFLPFIFVFYGVGDMQKDVSDENSINKFAS